MYTPLISGLDSWQRKEFELAAGAFRLQLGKRTKIMGVLNLTPNSFSNDGIYKDPQRAKEAVFKMVEQGADIIDIGGQSTRPGAQSISVDEELARVLPVIREISKKIKIPLSIDTTKSKVAHAALAEGASVVNDISGLKFDPQMADVIALFGAGCILMHIKGTPQTMQQNPYYASLIEEITDSLRNSVSKACAAGIDKRKIVIDPGIGFGKTTEHNLEIIKRLKEFSSLNLPILIGTSRKSLIGNVLNVAVEKRLMGTAATVAAAIFNGAHIIRVHDVGEMVQVARMVDAILTISI